MFIWPSLSLSLRKSAWFFLSSIIHIIIRTIKFFFVAFNIVVTITMLFIFCKNHFYTSYEAAKKAFYCLYYHLTLSSIIHIKWVIVSQLSLLLFGMLQRRNSLFFHNRAYTTTTADTLNHLRLKAVVLKSPKMLKEFVHS